MRVLFELDVPHASAHLPDVAEMFLTLALDDRANGRRWVLPHTAPVTQHEVQRAVADGVGTAAGHGRLAPGIVWLAGRFDKDLQEMMAVRDQ